MVPEAWGYPRSRVGGPAAGPLCGTSNGALGALGVLKEGVRKCPKGPGQVLVGGWGAEPHPSTLRQGLQVAETQEVGLPRACLGAM